MLHNAITWPPIGAQFMLRFELADAPTGGCRRAVNVRYEIEPPRCTLRRGGAFMRAGRGRHLVEAYQRRRISPRPTGHPWSLASFIRQSGVSISRENP